MKPFNKSIVGSFKMPEEKAPTPDIQNRMVKALCNARARQIRGKHECVQDAERAAREILIAVCDGRVRESAKTRTDSETMQPYTTFMWRAHTPAQLECIFGDFVRCMRAVTSSTKEEGKGFPALSKMACKVRMWPTISSNDNGYSMHFIAAFYPVYDSETAYETLIRTEYKDSDLDAYCTRVENSIKTRKFHMDIDKRTVRCDIELNCGVTASAEVAAVNGFRCAAETIDARDEALRLAVRIAAVQLQHEEKNG